MVQFVEPDMDWIGYLTSGAPNNRASTADTLKKYPFFSLQSVELDTRQQETIVLLPRNIMSHELEGCRRGFLRNEWERKSMHWNKNPIEISLEISIGFLFQCMDLRSRHSFDSSAH